MKFLDSLGIWSGKIRRKILLAKYRDAMQLRHNWGDINSLAVRQYVDELILEEAAPA